MSIALKTAFIVFFDHFKNFGLHSQQAADVQGVTRTILFAFHAVQAVVHVTTDQFDPHFPAPVGDLFLQLLHVEFLQTDDLIVCRGALSHVVIVGSQDGDGIFPVQILGDRLDDGGAFLGWFRGQTHPA